MTVSDQPNLSELDHFLDEDIGCGDITAEIIEADVQAKARIITRDEIVVCGSAWVNAIFHKLCSGLQIEWLAKEGSLIDANSQLCQLQGSARALLTGERTALNLLQTLSATASLSYRYAQAVSGTGCKVLDTRKTIPGLRQAQKYAVRCGGCFNHRIGLYDAVLIKENHILASGSIEKAVKKARSLTQLPVEIEVETLAEYSIALAARPDRIMLDNFSIPDLIQAVGRKQSDIELEASGDITLENIRDYAETGVDFISIGALTKNVQATNLSMRIDLETEND